jgi:hypothetical protein
VYLPQDAPWVHNFVEECAAFPTGAHDDQVDAMTQALIRIRSMAPSTGRNIFGVGTPIDPEFRYQPGWIKKAFDYL